MARSAYPAGCRKGQISMHYLQNPLLKRRVEGFKKGWYKFSRNHISVAGLFLVLAVSFLAIFAPYVSPYPTHAGRFVNFAEASQPPSLKHPCGTDVFGRDVLSRIFFGFRYSLMMGVVVLSLVVVPGVVLGLIAGYYRGTWIDTVIMRITDIFLAVPSLILLWLSVRSLRRVFSMR